ncbi:MAG: hypothetical protein ACREX8_07830, partial [Gammaproteobacteria bacterium]
MAILTADLLEGMALSQDADGYEATRVFTLEQVGGGGADRLYQALQHPSLPRFGDPHPAIPDLRCTNRTAALAKGSSDTVVATLTYRVPKPQEQPAGEVGGSGGAPVPGVQRIGGTVQQTTTQKDRNGTAITVTATYPADYEDETLRGITDTQGGEVD